MRIEYETTLDDIADTHLRVAAQSRLARRTRWQSTLSIAVLTPTLVFLWLSLLGATLVERYVFAGFGAVVGAGGFWLYYRRGMKRRILNYLRERMQTDGPVPFAVELRDDCIWTRQGETQLLFEWSNVQEITDSPDGIELSMRDGGFVIVRSKGFPSHEDREQFKGIANQLLHRTQNR